MRHNKILYLCLVLSMAFHLFVVERFHCGPKAGMQSPIELDLLLLAAEQEMESPKVEEFVPPPPPSRPTVAQRPKVVVPKKKEPAPKAVPEPEQESFTSGAEEADPVDFATIKEGPTQKDQTSISQEVPRASGEDLEGARQKYLFGIRSRIEAHKYYPPLARRRNWQGKVTVKFTIGEDLRAKSVAVTNSSGYSILDEAALNAIQSAGPFPPPPFPSMLPIHLEVVIAYELR